jgi:methylenetetrahydrofolate reductase (NADPH)
MSFMKKSHTANEYGALLHTVREAYLEIFPTPTIESKLDVLEPRSYVAVTCSPTKGVDTTLDIVDRLSRRGFKVVPHVAARMVRDGAHLREIMKRLDDMPIVSIFVPGGDAARPVGKFESALDLLRAISEYDHKFAEIGIAAHPEGHPSIPAEVLLEQLLKKQEFANYLVTQMCFDAGALGSWLSDIRKLGIILPAWIGLPGVSDRSTLVTTSLRIGVGDSLRYLKNRGKIAARLLRSKSYRPDDLLLDLAPYLADPFYNISGHHIYCFNQVGRTERWRREFLDDLQAEHASSLP